MNALAQNANQKKLIFPGILIGVAIVLLSVVLKQKPPLVEGYDHSRIVDVVIIDKKMAAPIVSGFGRVEPKHIWQGVAEVSGKLIYRHPGLETGRVLPKGAVLLKIDPLEYQLKIDQAEENVNAAKAQLIRIDQEEKNLISTLSIEEKKFDLARQEFQRRLELNERKIISDSEFEGEKKNLLVQEQVVQDTQSKLKLLPDDRRVTQAQLSADMAALKDAQRKLEQTEVVLPFSARLGEVNVERDQVINQGEVMLVAQQLGQVEIKAELSLKDMRILIGSLQEYDNNQGLPSIDKLGLTGRVELQFGEIMREWSAQVTRVAETVNPDQATIGVYLEVDEDPEDFNPMVKPPLARGLLVTALIKGIESPHFIIPEKALHGDSIYLMDEYDSLQIKQVSILFRGELGVAIAGDIHAGDRLILNDLIPAVPDMLLRLPRIEGEAKP